MYIRIINELYENWMKLEVGKALSQLEIDLKPESSSGQDNLSENQNNEQKKQKNIFQALFGSKS